MATELYRLEKLKPHFGCVAHGNVLDLEKLGLLKMKEACDEVGRHALDHRIKVSYIGVIKASRGLNAIFGIGEFLL